MEQEQTTDSSTQWDAPTPAATEEPPAPAGDTQGGDAQNPAAESARTEADSDAAARDKIDAVNQKVADYMGKKGGTAGKVVGKVLGYGSELTKEGLDDLDKEQGSYGDKTVSGPDGAQVPQQRTIASQRADAGVEANRNARQWAGKYTENETLKKIAGHTAGLTSVAGGSIVDAGRGLYRGASNKVKSLFGLSNP